MTTLEKLENAVNMAKRLDESLYDADIEEIELACALKEDFAESEVGDLLKVLEGVGVAVRRAWVNARNVQNQLAKRLKALEDTLEDTED